MPSSPPVRPPTGPLRRRVAALVAVLLLLGLSASTATAGTSRTAAAGTSQASRLGTAIPAQGSVHGLGVSPPGDPQQEIASEFPRMRGDGINTAMLDVWWDIDCDTCSVLHPGKITVSDSDLKAAIKRAKIAGLQVYLEPKVWCPSCDDSWRGVVRPDDRAAFYANYTSYVTHYADLAEQAGVDVFWAGSEWQSIESDVRDWRQVIDAVRTYFHGPVTYEANWLSVSAVTFWDAVDFISVSAYFPLSNTDRPSQQQLCDAWRTSQATGFTNRHWVPELQQTAQQYGKKILFGEVGYVSGSFNTAEPYHPTVSHGPSQQAQADAYQAMLSSFQSQPWWLGSIWWEWKIEASPDYATYTPRAKVAESLLRTWYVDGVRPPRCGDELVKEGVTSTQPSTLPGGGRAVSSPGPDPARGPTRRATPLTSPTGAVSPPPPPDQRQAQAPGTNPALTSRTAARSAARSATRSASEVPLPLALAGIGALLVAGVGWAKARSTWR